jgi:hypothetical protein
MRPRPDGRYECAYCGAELDIAPDDDLPDVVVEDATGRSKMRILSLNGREVHRCNIRDSATREA